ncbi:MAG: tRNA (adenosine(37)-N6)-threonylcarbamoyltransferase complex dimerization subunit type 1 TsaB [Candidatus Peribacteraceae bacterium]|nr:tRNA (adenosine(37)-N6)-threonylcarbamoyltransferase complex dimerization subunit type 1 TsaB [Candidatus Peribacteraceae bacterium]
MKILFIAIAGSSPFFAIVDEKQVLGTNSVAENTDEAGLMPAISGLLADANLTLHDLTHIALLEGPGGFMSLRVGAALCNTLSFALGIPSAGLHGSDLQSACAHHQKDFVWLHSTKKALLFIRGFGKFAVQWPQAQLISIDDAKAMIEPESIFVGELIPEHREILKVSEVPDLLSVESVLSELLIKLDYKPNQTLVPWYGREA